MKAFLSRTMLGAFVLLSTALVAAAQDAAPGTPDKPSWRCLPASTVVAARLPEPTAFREALEQRTKLGRIMFDENLPEKLKAWVQKQDPDAWDEMTTALGRYNLKPEDFTALLNGPAGAALVVEPRESRQPLWMAVGWIEPGEDLAQRIMSAIDQGVEDELDQSSAALERYDIELDGQRVIHLNIPQTAHRWGQDGEPQHYVSARTNVFITRMGGRVLAAITVPTSQSRVGNMTAAERERIDWDQMSSVEQATGIFARFVERHHGEDGAFLLQVRQTPGLTNAMPEGVGLFELYANPPVLIRLGEQYVEQGGEADVMNVVRQLGLDQVGPVAMRTTLDGNIMRSGMFASIPAPRTGVLELIDQPALAPDIPQWVSKEVQAYSQMSVDLDQLYQRIRQMITNAWPQAGMSFAMFEQNVQQNLQMSISRILKSVGHKHVFVTYPIRLVDTEVTRWVDGEMKTTTVKQPQTRMGFVWQLQDPPVWDTLFNFMGQQAAAGPNAIFEEAQEQGFTGLRSTQDVFSVAAFTGRGHLVVTMGEDTASPTLAMLRNPPEADNRLRNSEAHRRAQQIMPPREGIAYSIADYEGYLVDMRRMIMAILEMQISSSSYNDDAKVGRDFMDTFIPGDDELRGTTGVAASQMYTTEHGLVGESAAELPAGE